MFGVVHFVLEQWWIRVHDTAILFSKAGKGLPETRSINVAIRALEARCLLAVDHVIAISVDGLAAGRLEQLMLLDEQHDLGEFASFRRLRDEGSSTFNARTDFSSTYTLPNHTSMLTARPVDQPNGMPNTVHHNWTANTDPSRDATLHLNQPHVDYVPSVFDVVHDHGLPTGLFTGKTKFSLFDVSYNDANGSEDLDPSGGDNGQDKLGRLPIPGGYTIACCQL